MLESKTKIKLYLNDGVSEGYDLFRIKLGKYVIIQVWYTYLFVKTIL